MYLLDEIKLVCYKQIKLLVIIETIKFILILKFENKQFYL